jgi:hypothetical protein
MPRAIHRDALLLGFGIVIGALGVLLWPRSTFEQCMLDKIHDPALLRSAYMHCKDLPRSTQQRLPVH